MCQFQSAQPQKRGPPINNFNNYNLKPEILEALSVLKYNEPTKIQEKVIPLALQGKNIVVKSSTGSGKTAAFAIPLCNDVEWEWNEPQVLVLEPTRELTVQVKEEIYQIGRKRRIKVPDLFGGFPIDKQIQTLKQKSHIVVGTPGRVLDHIRRESLKLERITTVIIDEADLMLDMGFINDVESILQQIPNRKMTMLLSATIKKEMAGLLENYMGDYEHIEVEDIAVENSGHIIEKAYEVSLEEKYAFFLDILMQENPESAMIFCGTKEMVNVLCRMLRKDGVKASMIHGDIDQQDRIRTIDGFRMGKFRYLIATDVIARGIDFENLSHVFNYDFPTGKETYVHRIGRTGRNGATGIAVSFITPGDLSMKKQVEALVGYELPITSYEESTKVQRDVFLKRQEEKPKIRPKKGADFSKEITKLSIGGGAKSKMRTGDIVGTICNIDGVAGDDIGVIDIRSSLCYVEILNGKGQRVYDALQAKTIKGKIRKVKKIKM